LLELAGNRPSWGADSLGHYILQFEVGHANDAGALTIVSVAAPEGNASTSRRSQESGAREHLASLQRLRRVVSAFAQRGDACESDGNPASSLLLLSPTRCPPHSSFETVMLECFRLRDERDILPLQEHSEEPRRRAPSFTERFCVLPSPPGSEHLSWDTSDSATPSLVSSPGMRTSTEKGDGEVGLSKASVETPDLISASTKTRTTSPGPSAPGSTPGPVVDSLQKFLRALAAADVTFDAEAWLQRVQEEGRSADQQVQDLLEIIFKMQRAHREVVEITQHMLLNWTEIAALREAAAPRPRAGYRCGPEGRHGCAAGGATGHERLRWSHLPGPGTTVRVEAPGLRSSSSRLAGRPGGTAVVRQPLHSTAVAGGPFSTSSPRWAPSSDRSPVRQLPRELTFHEVVGDGASMELMPGGSPLMRSRSANFPSGSMLSFVQRAGCSMTIHSDVTTSPQVPPRDVSPARSRSLMQTVALTAISAATAPAPSATATMRSSIVPFQLGPAANPLLPGPVPSFPPPVQVPAGTGVSIDSQVMMSSPRKDYRVHVEDGIRSPLPAPPSQSLPKAADWAPHSARSGLVVGGGGLPAARNAEGWGTHGMRWDQASPCRMRLVAGGAGAASATGAGAPAAPGRPVLGPPPKAAPPQASMTRGPASLAQVHVAAMTSKSPSKCVRTQR